jgi:hypothetical protein
MSTNVRNFANNEKKLWTSRQIPQTKFKFALERLIEYVGKNYEAHLLHISENYKKYTSRISDYWLASQMRPREDLDEYHFSEIAPLALTTSCVYQANSMQFYSLSWDDIGNCGIY